MTWNDEIRQFVEEHIADDTSRLLLSARRYPGIDVPFAVDQIEARRRLKNKLPEWYALPDLIMAGRIPAEQCSSEQTARFKRSVMLSDARSLCDMTGGMGVDLWYMSQGLTRAIYTERQPALCEIARHNFAILANVSSESPCPQIEIREGLSTNIPVPDVDVIFLDPARRSTDGSRIYEISECEPDVVAWQDELLEHCCQLITKVSPMADISRTISRLKYVTEIYVVSVRNECKELLIVQQKPTVFSDSQSKPVVIHCVDMLASRNISFDYQLDTSFSLWSKIPLASEVGPYFYEPDISIMKAQGFFQLSACYNVKMLDSDCHYFVSDQLILDFPGRIFQVDEQMPFSSRTIKSLRSKLPKANIAVRNFPLSAEQLRTRLGACDGGELYLFGASLNNRGAVLILCRKINLM